MDPENREHRRDVSGRDKSGHGKKRNPASFIVTFLILFVVWILLSGKFDVFHLMLGVVSCAIVSHISSDLLIPFPDLQTMPGLWLRFIKYLPWLLYQVFLANFHVMYLVFHPRMMEKIDPQVMEFKSVLTSDMALLTLANSITLTPGTITIYISVYGDVTVHMIDVESGKSTPQIMDKKIAEVFGE